ncbi:MAG TPA: plastocyanin/azurin family copper-binding protein [Solirubrobacteraceae bacterium]|nr:plastocyanin/azurin family copper-binding protein [Solirubrobacteraceae bacterium]
MTKRISLLAVAPVAIALIIAGCGGGNDSTTTASTTASSSSGGGGQGQVVKLSADPGGQLRFTMAKLTAKPGKVTLSMLNPTSAGMEHGIAIEGNGVDSDGPSVAPGKTSNVTVTLKKGTYTYYCPVPGHKQAGMVGTLTVR